MIEAPPRDRRRDWCALYEQMIQGMALERAQALVNERWVDQYARGDAALARLLGKPTVIERDGHLFIELEKA